MVKKSVKQSDPKRLPYGNADFNSIRTENNYVYVDKTRFIEILEKEGAKSKIFIRPRRFGKSLFLSMLDYYYDINYKKKFKQLFGDLYIGKNPTSQRNSYVVMGFNFSGINTTSIEAFQDSFFNSIRNTVCRFLDKHANIFPDAINASNQINNPEYPVFSALDWSFRIAAKSDIRIFVIIDEYDHFANDLIALDSIFGEGFYKKVINANGLVRDFYEKLKAGSDSGIIANTFITGISPVMLDDLTSGYNITDNITLDFQYNEMLGFTQDEVNMIMQAVNIEANQINIDMKSYYNGYIFNRKAK
ncbi:MAG: AAA family ATPase, partial [Planctomycetaceae bacterium]|nr:AAA family ATPase [Planctomycetaceae bacterium]